MSALLSQQFRQWVGDRVLADITTGNNSYYLFVGRILPWSNESAPPAPTDAIANTVYEYDRSMIALKRITPTDVCYVIPRNTWANNTYYPNYDSTNANLYSQQYFVTSSALNLYKCLYAPSGNSTVEPTGTANTILATADGYQWKFMSPVNPADAVKFLTSNYSPVRSISADDSTTHWQVQQYAGLTSSNGALDVIRVTNGGTGYSAGNTVVAITGDGVGSSGTPGTTANATATVAGGIITAITLTDRGRNYSNAVVTITGAGANAAAYAIIPPPPYHGANTVLELGGSNLMISMDLDGNENGVFTVNNDYRRIGILYNPLLSSNGAVATAAALDQSLRLTITISNPPGTNFVADELVTGQTSNATGYVVDWNGANNTNILRLVSTDGAFANSEIVTGGTSGSQGTVTSITLPALIPFSGRMLYAENREAVTRASDQTEEVRIIWRF